MNSFSKSSNTVVSARDVAVREINIGSAHRILEYSFTYEIQFPVMEESSFLNVLRIYKQWAELVWIKYNLLGSICCERKFYQPYITSKNPESPLIAI